MRAVAVAAVLVLAACASASPPDGAFAVDTPQPSASEQTPPATAPPDATPSPTSPVRVRAANVTGIVDGDTIDVRLDGRIERVRLIGVDTPERGQRWSAEATALTRARLEGRRAWLEYDVERRDRYGRLLAYVWGAEPASRARSEVRSKMHNATLVLQGLAVLLTIPPNVAYVEHLRTFQGQARANERGIWSVRPAGDCDPSYPDVCIPPPPPDLDCGDIEHRNFRVTGSDPHRFDGNGDGRACEGEV